MNEIEKLLEQLEGALRSEVIGMLLRLLEAALLIGDAPRVNELENEIDFRLVTAVPALTHAPPEVRRRAVRQQMEIAAAYQRAIPHLISERFEFLVDGERGGAESEPGSVFPIWFGTNRKPADAIDIGKGFTTERHDCTTLGRVDVWVPEAHRFGETGNGFWTRLKRWDLRDDKLRIQRIERRDAAAFWEDIQAEMEQARTDGEPPHALVFLHGYNNSFEAAAIRAAQIGFDLKVPGATAFFSWPSRGTLAGYPADEASIDASERAITDFLVDFVAKCGAEKVHLVAHSMGNRGLLRALQRIAADAEHRGKVRFGQIFLAAPDVDRDLFLELAHLYSACSERTTLYASHGDLPVYLSAKFHDAPRAGYYTPYTVTPGVDTIAVPDFDIDLLGHAYFAQADALLHDIYDLMRHNDPPPRQRMAEADQDGNKFWNLRL